MPVIGGGAETVPLTCLCMSMTLHLEVGMAHLVTHFMAHDLSIFHGDY
jgi:hypothetical protein